MNAKIGIRVKGIILNSKLKQLLCFNIIKQYWKIEFN